MWLGDCHKIKYSLRISPPLLQKNFWVHLCCSPSNNQLTPRSRALPENLTVPQLGKVPEFYGTRRFIAALTRALQLSTILSQMNPVHTPHLTSWRSVSILSFSPSENASKPSKYQSPYRLHAKAVRALDRYNWPAFVDPEYELYVQVTVHRDNLRINNQRDAASIQNFYFVTKLYMFRASSVPIIRSNQLYRVSAVCVHVFVSCCPELTPRRNRPSWEAHKPSASQEIPRMLRNVKVNIPSSYK
jgi:hypothetical protein